MKCPACYNELTPHRLGGVTVDVCEGGCGGAWFDAFELQRVAQTEHAAEELASVPHAERLHLDQTRKRDCPRCDAVKLIRHFASGLRRVEVDHCPSCGGYWLDYGELDKVLAEKQEEASTRAARQTTINMTMIREIYRMKLERSPE
jgi:Zn-finger nucleic acid-binding protein